MSSPTTDHRKRRKKQSSSTKQITCSGCSYIFKSNDELLQHKLGSQNVLCQQDVHNCNNCGKSFLSAFGLEMHMMKSSKCYVATLLRRTHVFSCVFLFLRTPLRQQKLMVSWTYLASMTEGITNWTPLRL